MRCKVVQVDQQLHAKPRRYDTCHVISGDISEQSQSYTDKGYMSQCQQAVTERRNNARLACLVVFRSFSCAVVIFVNCARQCASGPRDSANFV